MLSNIGPPHRAIELANSKETESFRKSGCREKYLYKSLQLKLVHCRDPFRSPIFLLYINDLSEKITSPVKPFADDAYLFSVMNDLKISAKELNKDFIDKTWDNFR